jgi:hypothetical protein
LQRGITASCSAGACGVASCGCMLCDPGESAGALRSRAHRGGAAQARTGSPRPHLHRERAHPAHICAGTGLTPPASAPGLHIEAELRRRARAHPCPHLRRDWAHPAPHLHRDWAHPTHICTGIARGSRTLFFWKAFYNHQPLKTVPRIATLTTKSDTPGGGTRCSLDKTVTTKSWL